MCVKQKFSLTTQRYFRDLRKKPELQSNFHKKYCICLVPLGTRDRSKRFKTQKSQIVTKTAILLCWKQVVDLLLYLHFSASGN